MTVTTQIAERVHTGNGAATEFPTGFKIIDAAHLLVTLREGVVDTPLALNIDYTVSGIGDEAGATVTYKPVAGPLTSQQQLVFVREMPLVQESSIRNQTGFFPAVLEDAYDYAVMLIQQISSRLSRTMQYPAGITFNAELPLPQPNRVMIWNAEGTAFEAGPTANTIQDAEALLNSLVTNARRQVFTAVAGQTTFVVTGGYIPATIDVFLNGAKLINGTDVTVTSGVSIVLTEPAVAGDTLEVLTFSPYVPTDVYTKSEVDAFIADLQEDIDTELAAQFSSRAAAQAATVPAGINLLRVIHANHVLWYVADAAGTALTTGDGRKWSPAVRNPSFLYWGALGDGVSNDATAIKAALESGYGIENPRFMEFAVRTEVLADITDKLYWRGGRIIYNRGAGSATLMNGIRIRKSDNTPENSAVAHISEVDFLTQDMLTKFALRLQLNTLTGTVYQHTANVDLRGLYIGPYNNTVAETATAYFTETGIDLVDMTGIFLDTIEIGGQRVTVAADPENGVTNQPLGTHGIRCRTEHATHTYVRVLARNIHVRAVDKAWEFTGFFEGVKLSQLMLVSCNRGLVFNPTDENGDGAVGYETVGLFVTDSHMNCEQDCVSISGGAEVYLSNLELYGFRNTSVWNGIHLGVGNKFVRDFRIYGCTFSGGNSTTFTRNGIKLEDRCDRGKIFDNFGINLTAFCDVASLTTPSNPVRVRDNEWLNKSSVLQASLATQTTDNTKVSAAWSY